jgi:hypothetical protein
MIMTIFRPRWVLPAVALALAACGARVVGPAGDAAAPGAGGGAGGAGQDGPSFPASDFRLPPAPDGGTPPPGVGGAGGGGVGEGPTCSEQVHAAQPVPVDLLLLVDGSSSMGEAAGTSTKLRMVREALVAFAGDARSAGLSIGLTFFPVPDDTECNSNADCGPFNSSAGKPEWWGCHPPMVCAPPNAPLGTAYNVCAPATASADCFARGTSCVTLGYCSHTGWPCSALDRPCQSGTAGDTCKAWPRVCNASLICNPAFFREPVLPIAELPGNAAALRDVLAERAPEGATPMGPAVEGSLAHLAQRLAARPGRAGALVLATDGLPLGCGPADDIRTIAGRLSAAAAGRPAIPTYVIGVLPTGQPDTAGARMGLAQLAQAGGTGQPFLVTPTGDLTQTFLAALDQIRGRALPCEFLIPGDRVALLDFGKVNLRFLGSAGEENLPYVGRPERCDATRGGWYYDVDPATGGSPTRVITCEATCRKLKADPRGRIDLRFGCKTVVIE